jgi:hypothetical protein
MLQHQVENSGCSEASSCRKDGFCFFGHRWALPETFFAVFLSSHWDTAKAHAFGASIPISANSLVSPVP